jgi:hypothetical protein
VAVAVLGHGDVGHRRLRRSAMPVLRVRRNSHDISGSNFFGGLTPSLDAADASGDDQDLTSRMRVPRRPGAGREGDGAAARVRRIVCLEQHLDTHVTREVGGWPWPDGPRAAAHDVDLLRLRRRRREQNDRRQRGCECVDSHRTHPPVSANVTLTSPPWRRPQ